MRFTWDEAKRESNLSKHGYDFVDAETVLSGATFTFEDDRFAYGEQRIISMRKATKHERRIYFRSFTD